MSARASLPSSFGRIKLRLATNLLVCIHKPKRTRVCPFAGPPACRLMPVAEQTLHDDRWRTLCGRPLDGLQPWPRRAGRSLPTEVADPFSARAAHLTNASESVLPDGFARAAPTARAQRVSSGARRHSWRWPRRWTPNTKPQMNPDGRPLRPPVQFERRAHLGSARLQSRPT